MLCLCCVVVVLRLSRVCVVLRCVGVVYVLSSRCVCDAFVRCVVLRCFSLVVCCVGDMGCVLCCVWCGV